ncbi:hypothetical protein [Mediterraneibacter gnavus]|uniref:hypothetical protein n=1 Tax=Mediterraneibacter gnavus TaxID=33038 RepID=UPI0004B12CE6|nr:hypothetical protein [Mediterraneibacter gnavus]
MQSILMIGQSNMVGRGFINEVLMICSERIQMLRNAEFAVGKITDEEFGERMRVIRVRAEAMEE